MRVAGDGYVTLDDNSDSCAKLHGKYGWEICFQVEHNSGDIAVESGTQLYCLGIDLWRPIGALKTVTSENKQLNRHRYIPYTVCYENTQ